jgi:hypothetical protein
MRKYVRVNEEKNWPQDVSIPNIVKQDKIQKKLLKSAPEWSG